MIVPEATPAVSVLWRGGEDQFAGRRRVDGLLLRSRGDAAGRRGRYRRRSGRGVRVLEACRPAPAGIVSGDKGANAPLLDVVVKLTVRALPASTGLPNESSSASVIVPDATPAVRVCGAVVKTSWLAAAGLTVSCCAAKARLAAAAVIVGDPAAVSVYWKVTEPPPAGIVSGETGMKVPLPELVLKLTVNALAAATGLPKASSIERPIVLEVVPAVIVCGGVVNSSWLAAAGLTVSCCMAGPMPLIVAVMVGFPAAVSV